MTTSLVNNTYYSQKARQPKQNAFDVFLFVDNRAR